MQLSEIPYEPPGGEEIAVSVQGLHTGKVGYPSGIRAEHLQGWIREATQEKEPDTRRWEKKVSLKTEVPRGAPPSGSDMDYYGATTKRGRVLKRNRVSGSYLEAMCIHHEQMTLFLHHPAQYTARFQTEERDRVINFGDEDGSTDHGDMT